MNFLNVHISHPKHSLILLLVCMPLLASTLPQNTNNQIEMFVPLQEIEGVVSWKTLAKVKQIPSKNRISPQFPKEISDMNDEEIKLQGYMMPPNAGAKHKPFLISIVSSTCSYCLPTGPDDVVEVRSKTPIKFTYEPIILSGKMEILTNDPMGLYYRLTEASITSEK